MEVACAREQLVGQVVAGEAAIVPIDVRIARSRWWARMTLAPVGSDGSTRHDGHVDAALRKRVQHPAPERIVADDPHERDLEPEPRRATR